MWFSLGSPVLAPKKKHIEVIQSKSETRNRTELLKKMHYTMQEKTQKIYRMSIFFSGRVLFHFLSSHFKFFFSCNLFSIVCLEEIVKGFSLFFWFIFKKTKKKIIIFRSIVFEHCKLIRLINAAWVPVLMKPFFLKKKKLFGCALPLFNFNFWFPFCV